MTDVSTALFILLGAAFLVGRVRLDLPWGITDLANQEPDNQRIGIFDLMLQETLIELPLLLGAALVLFTFVIAEPTRLGTGQWMVVLLAAAAYLLVLPYRAFRATTSGIARAVAALVPMAYLGYALYPHLVF